MRWHHVRAPLEIRIDGASYRCSIAVATACQVSLAAMRAKLQNLDTIRKAIRLLFRKYTQGLEHMIGIQVLTDWQIVN